MQRCKWFRDCVIKLNRVIKESQSITIEERRRKIRTQLSWIIVDLLHGNKWRKPHWASMWARSRKWKLIQHRLIWIIAWVMVGRRCGKRFICGLTRKHKEEINFNISRWQRLFLIKLLVASWTSCGTWRFLNESRFGIPRSFHFWIRQKDFSLPHGASFISTHVVRLLRRGARVILIKQKGRRTPVETLITLTA